jgi:hypothetical protein
VLALLIAILVAVCLLGGIEWRLREAGFRPNVRDSVELWASQRARASQLGKKALILVGASRIQLAIDLDTLRSETGLEPVQLAIDGSSNLPVLEDLANDPSVTGTILVSTHAGLLIPKARPDRADEWVKSYNESYRGLYSPVIETHLKSSLMAYSALYSSALPFDLFPSVITGEYQKDQYLITERNRERDADHRLVKMPDFYATRVVLHLGGLDGRTGARNLDEFNQLVSSAIKALPQQDNSDYFKQLAYVYSLAGKIQERGGRVGFLRMPTDKWVWITDEKRYPRAMFWDLFAVGSPVPTFHFKDFARLAEHDLPDGSHIDKRDKRQFTRSLAEILNQDLLQEKALKAETDQS